MMPSSSCSSCSSSSSSRTRRVGAGCCGRLRFHLASVLLAAMLVVVALSSSPLTKSQAAAFLPPPPMTSGPRCRRSSSPLPSSQRSSKSSRSRGSRGSGVGMLLAYPKDVRPQIKVNDIVIPVAARVLQQPPQLVALGLYVGIEYRVLGIAVMQEKEEEEEGEGQGSVSVPVTRLSSIGEEDLGRVRVTLRPRYRLTKRYDRPWPIEVAFADLPTLLYPTMYNALTLGSFLLAGALGRAFVMLVYVPSFSMAPSIQSGDLLLVEEVSKYFLPLRRGDIVAFRPPPNLKALIAARASQSQQQPTGGRETTSPSIRPPIGADLFVKRVGCLAGDTALLQEDRLLCSTPNQAQLLQPPHVHTGTPSAAIAAAVDADTDDDKDSLMAPRDLAIPEGFYVVGDNPNVSIDSRVWGTVPKDHIVGRAVWRLLPLSRFGPLDQ